MGTRKVPWSGETEENRVKASVPFCLWYVRQFPVSLIGGKLDKDLTDKPWLMGLLEDIRTEGRILNPLTIWNHHANRGKKQPAWLLRAGSNRMWCIEQLGWHWVPAIVSTLPGELPPGRAAHHILPRAVQGYYPDGGKIWVNEHGFGLLAAKAPEETYADYQVTDAQLAEIRSTNHRTGKIINPLTED